MNFNEMVNCLDRLKLKYSVIQTKDGGILVVLLRGARMLGIFPDQICGNLLWTAPELSDPDSAQLRFVQGKEWNIGGDRTWLSPEIEYNIADLDDLWNTYAIQSAIDPGNYQFGYTDSVSASLTQYTTAQAYRSHMEIPLEIRKAFCAISDPLLQIWTSSEEKEKEYSFTGYQTETSLNLVSRKTTAPLSLWHLAQLPAGGQVIIPTYGRAKISHFFGSPGSPGISIQSNAVNLTIDAKESYKVSIKVPYITGRMGYYREVDPYHATLIVRHFDTKPAEEYGDVFYPNLNDPGHCVQGYNDDGKLGDFGEMEYHTPLMKRAGARLSLADINETYCYSGETRVIAEIRSVLLG